MLKRTEFPYVFLSVNGFTADQKDFPSAAFAHIGFTQPEGRTQQDRYISSVYRFGNAS